MINYVELILFIILLVLMQEKPEFLIHSVSNPIINIIAICLIAFIAKTQSLSAGILIALIYINLRHNVNIEGLVPKSNIEGFKPARTVFNKTNKYIRRTTRPFFEDIKRKCLELSDNHVRLLHLNEIKNKYLESTKDLKHYEELFNKKLNEKLNNGD